MFQYFHLSADAFPEIVHLHLVGGAEVDRDHPVPLLDLLDGGHLVRHQNVSLFYKWKYDKDEEHLTKPMVKHNG